MFLLKKAAQGDVRGALVVSDEGIAAARVRRQAGAPVLEHCAWYPLQEGEEPAARLKAAASAASLGRAGCSSLLSIGEYQLLLVEAPEVPAAELRAAIRWRIKDLIDFHVDDAVLDVFDAPPGGARDVQDHLYVVVARASLVQKRIGLLEDAGVALDVIDIPELALRNLAGLLPQDEQGVALLYFQRDRGLITLTRNKTLYLARSLEIGYQQLRQSPALVDQLVLEVQRSLDYYDRHFQQAPVAALAIAPLPEPVPALTDTLQSQLGTPSAEIELGEILSCPEPVSTAAAARCLLAVGAALRSEVAAL